MRACTFSKPRPRPIVKDRPIERQAKRQILHVHIAARICMQPLEISRVLGIALHLAL
jgi:hypothetical protein